MENNIDFDAILRPFVSNEPSRFSIHKPFVSGDWTAATDGKVLCAVPTDIFVRDDYEREKVPELDKIWGDGALMPVPKRVSLKSLALPPLDERLKVLGTPPIVPDREYRDCRACNGTGRCKCKCKGEHACGKYCDKGKVLTKGSIAKQDTYRRSNGLYKERAAAFEKEYVWLLGVPLEYSQLHKMCAAAANASQKSLTFLAIGPPDKVVIAESGPLRFAVMPPRVDKRHCAKLNVR